MHNARAATLASGALMFALARGYRDLGEKLTATVIVVDDDISMRRALEVQLKILGFEVSVFASAEELLASEIPNHNACLLLDLFMPGMGGIELSRNLIALGCQLPTILMSGRNDRGTREIMRKARPVAGLFKPFDEQVLVRVIQKALSVAPKLLH